jgi:hypothetical protein
VPESPSQNCLLTAVAQHLQERTQFALPICEQVANRLVTEYALMATKSVQLQRLSIEERDGQILNALSFQVGRIGEYTELRTQQRIWAKLMAVLRNQCSGLAVSAEWSANKRDPLIQVFLTEYLAKVWQQFRKERELPNHYQPRHPLQIAEWAAFAERYSRRQIRWRDPNGNQCEERLIRLRALDFNKKLTRDEKIFTSLDNEGLDNIVIDREAPAEVQDRQLLQAKLVKQLIDCLKERQQEDVVRYFALLLSDTPTSEIQAILGLTTEERESLQERYKFHKDECLFRRYWRERLEALGHDLETLGLTTSELQAWCAKLPPEQRAIWEGLKHNESEAGIAASLQISVKKMQSLWRNALLSAEKFRNRT